MSFPRVLTATEMKRVRCFSAIHVVSDGAGWDGGAAAGTRTTTFSVAPRCNLIKKTSKLKSTTLENMKNQY